MTIDNSSEDYWVQALTRWSATAYIDYGIIGPFSWTGASGAGVTIKYGLNQSTLFSDYEDENGNPIPTSSIASHAASISSTLSLISEVADITFVRNDTNPDITIVAADMPSGVTGETIPSVTGSIVQAADVYISDNYSDFSFGSQGASTLLHEMLHALGVSHPDDAYATVIEPTGYDSDFDNSTTIMSYLSNEDNAGIPATLGAFDIATVQFLYGENDQKNHGDTEYLFYGNNDIVMDDSLEGTSSYIGAVFLSEPIVSIWDTGGEDTFRAYQAITSDLLIDLRYGLEDGASGYDEPHHSHFNEQAGDGLLVTIAYPADGLSGSGVIENAVGASGDDEILGNDVGNVLEGGHGDDVVEGFAGNDEIVEGFGQDYIYGGDGFDIVQYLDLDAYDTDLLDFNVVITALNKTNGDYKIEFDYLSQTDETDFVYSAARIAHAEQRANTYVNSVQNNPSVSARSGGYVSFWESAGQGGKSQAIVRQEFDHSGNLVGAEDLVMNGGGSNQINPESDQSGSGGYVVAFQGRNGSNKIKTFAKVFDSSGNPGTLDIEVFKDPNTGNTAYDNALKTAEFAKDVAVLNSGNILAVAQAAGNFTQSGQFDIISKFLDSGGNAIGQKFIVNDDAQAGWQTEPSVAALSNGFAVVTWRSLDQHYYGVFYKVLDSSGGTIKSTTQANDTYYYTQEDSDVAGLANGGFVITWTDQGSADGSGYGVFFKMFDNFGNEVTTYDRDGNPLSGNVQVNQQTTGTQWQSEVTALDDGGFVITFTDNQSTADGSAASVWAQQYDRFGMALQDNFLVNITTSGTQQNTAIAALNNGDFAVAWEDQTGDIYERLYSNSAPIPTGLPGSSSAMSSGGGSGSGTSSLLAAEPEATPTQVAANEMQSFGWGGFTSAPAPSSGSGNFGGGFFGSFSPAPVPAQPASPTPQPTPAIQVTETPPSQEPPLYEEPDFFIRGNGVADIIRISQTDVRDEYVEIFDSFKADEGDVLDLSELFTPTDHVSEAIADFIAFSEADGDTLVLVDQDGSGEEHHFQTVAYLQGTLGLDAQELIASENLIV